MTLDQLSLARHLTSWASHASTVYLEPGGGCAPSGGGAGPKYKAALSTAYGAPSGLRGRCSEGARMSIPRACCSRSSRARDARIAWRCFPRSCWSCYALVSHREAAALAVPVQDKTTILGHANSIAPFMRRRRCGSKAGDATYAAAQLRHASLEQNVDVRVIQVLLGMATYCHEQPTEARITYRFSSALWRSGGDQTAASKARLRS